MKYFFLVFWMGSSCWAVSPQQQFMTQFQSTRVQFPDENSVYRDKNVGRYSPFLNFLFQNILGWVPDGHGKELSPNCASELWARRLANPKVAPSVQLQGALIQKYFRDCAAELETGRNSEFANLTQMMSTKLEPEKNPFLHQVVFSLPGNIKLKGLLALKGDFKKRPLVILRLGVFSNVEEFMPERSWFMMLFEQTPFNVLVVENMSGSDFIADNSRFAFGGYDEGIQNILLAQILKDPNEPLSRLVESLHLFGVSLGGHGVFFASLLNSLNSTKGRPLFQSFMAACPVVNLETTMHHLSSTKPFAYLVDLWSRKRLAGLPEKLPSVNDHDSFAFLEKSVSEVARTYQGGLSYVTSVKLPSGMVDGPEFWKLNDFWGFYKSVQDPVLVLATHNDPIVPFGLNSQTLQSRKLNSVAANISVVEFPRGIHCTLPVPYDWKVISSLTQSYILSHAPGFKTKPEALEMDIGAAKENAVALLRVLPFDGKDKFVRLEITVRSSNEPLQKINLNLPLSEFDFRFLNSELSPSEQWMIERWVNQNLQLEVFNHDKKSFLRTSWNIAD
jgi:hypothetical protein